MVNCIKRKVPSLAFIAMLLACQPRRCKFLALAEVQTGEIVAAADGIMPFSRLSTSRSAKNLHLEPYYCFGFLRSSSKAFPFRRAAARAAFSSRISGILRR